MSNVFSFYGTLGRDAEVRYTASGMVVLSATVANNIGFGDKQQTLWIRVNLWGNRAEGRLKDYLKKGQQVFVSGELTQSEYRANDGTTKTSLELNANIIDLIGKRSDDRRSGGKQSQKKPVERAAPMPTKAISGYDEFDDEIPF